MNDEILSHRRKDIHEAAFFERHHAMLNVGKSEIAIVSTEDFLFAPELNFERPPLDLSIRLG